MTLGFDGPGLARWIGCTDHSDVKSGGTYSSCKLRRGSVEMRANTVKEMQCNSACTLSLPNL